MEVKVGFEPTILRICSPLPWAARPLHHNLVIQNSIRSRPNRVRWNNLTQECKADVAIQCH
jgi:hypothetical protein